MRFSFSCNKALQLIIHIRDQLFFSKIMIPRLL